MNIQPSIVARLKPELVPERVELAYGWQGEVIGGRKWQPLEYRDQELELQPDEDAAIGQTAEIGNIGAEIVLHSTIGQRVRIRVQFHHKIEV